MGECTLFRAEVALSANSIAVLDFNIAALDSGTRSVSGHDQGQSGLELEEVRDGTDHCHLGLNLWLGKKKTAADLSVTRNAYCVRSPPGHPIQTQDVAGG